jgi:hypothetical protein
VEADEAVHYPTEFFNSLDLPGMPPHVLQLKMGMPIIMLRNINQPKLCNSTQLAVTKLMSNVIEATILTGPFKGEDVLIPRIPLIPTDMPFQFKRLQFPIRTISISAQTMVQQKIPTSIVKLYILQTCSFSFLSCAFNQTEPQHRVVGYGE